VRGVEFVRIEMSEEIGKESDVPLIPPEGFRISDRGQIVKIVFSKSP
jgi:hypothetical protein